MADAAYRSGDRRRWWEPATALGVSGVGAGVVTVLSAVASPSIAAVVLIAMTATVIVVVFAPGVALIAMAFVVPLERMGRFGNDLELETFSVMRLVGLVAFLAVLIQMAVRRQRPEISSPIVLCVILQAQAFASTFYALDAQITNARALTMLGAPLMLFTLAQGVRSWRMLDNLILAWLAATILGGLYQLYDWHFGSSLSDLEVGVGASRFSTTINALSEQGTLGAARRAMGPTSNPAVYGVNLLLAVPFLFYRLQIARSLAAKTFWMLSIPLIFYNLLLTNTRAVLIFAVILCLMIVMTGLFRLTVARVGLSILALVAAIPLLPQSVWDQILNVQAYDLDKATNLAWRFDLWEAAVRLGSEHWLSGIGVGNNTALIALLDPTRFDGAWIMAHNEFLQTYTELGIPGLLVFVALIASMLWTAAVVMRRCSGHPAMARHYWFAAAALCSLAIGPMFAMQVDAFHFPLKGWWLVAGLALVADRLTREQSSWREGEPANVR